MFFERLMYSIVGSKFSLVSLLISFTYATMLKQYLGLYVAPSSIKKFFIFVLCTKLIRKEKDCSIFMALTSWLDCLDLNSSCSCLWLKFTLSDSTYFKFYQLLQVHLCCFYYVFWDLLTNRKTIALPSYYNPATQWIPLHYNSLECQSLFPLWIRLCWGCSSDKLTNTFWQIDV